MQSKDIIKLGTIVEVAVVDPHAYVPKGGKALDQILRGQTRRITLISVTQKYASTSHIDTTGQREFVKASSDDRSAGFLVQEVGSPNRFVVKAQDILAEYKVLDALWVTKEAEQATAQAEQTRRMTIRESEENRLRYLQDPLKENIAKSLRGLLGDATAVSVNISIDGKWNDDYTAYNATNTGSVSINLKDFQRLLETVYEARELADA